jgi:hypothetical protein
MVFVCYLVSAILTGFVFSFITSMLLVFGIEQTGGDLGTPTIMFVGFMCSSGILSIITALIMSGVKAKYQKEFPTKFSVIIFLVMYLPFHINGIYFSERQLDFLSTPFAIMLFLSYVPFFHMTAQSLINVVKFFRRRKITA